MNRDHLEYNLKEIRRHKGIPFDLANETLADEQFPYIKQDFPGAQMIKYDICQYIIVTDRARKVLIKRLDALKTKYETWIQKLDEVIKQLKENPIT